MPIVKRQISFQTWHLPALLSACMAVLLSWLAVVSPGTEGGMDSYEHYLIARYSWKYPQLFLDQWGKPLYTMFASPFAQFGYLGVVFLNIGLIILCAWLVWLTARNLGFKYPLMAFAGVLFAPIFLDNTLSGLTEPFNAAMLAGIFFLFSYQSYTWAALISGFLPYARSEGYVILAVIGIYLLFYRKDYRATLLLFAGSLVFNFLGWWLDHPPGEAGDPFWVITHNPYLSFELSGRNICGSGPLLHYVKISNYIFGRMLLILIGLACLLIPFRFFQSLRKEKPAESTISFLFFFAFGIFALYFSVHSIIWKLGMMGSCGLQRVMVVIIPSSAIMCAWILEQGIDNLPEYLNKIKIWLFTFVLLLVIAEPFNYAKGKYPLQVSDEQKLFTEFASWYKTQEFEQKTVYFFYPYLNVILDIDPYDSDSFIKLWSFDESWAPYGSIVIWDGHFGPNECNIQLDHLQNNPKFKPLKSFKPDVPFKTLNNYDFEIHVFEWLGNQ